ncbi:MAG: BREX system ATP-binding domain-containing protein [Spirochaetaceae bacterium]
MHIGEYVDNRGFPLGPREAADLWYSTVQALNSALERGQYHSRLTLASFDVDPSPPKTEVVLSDPSFLTAEGGENILDTVWSLAAPEQTALAGGAPGVRSNIYTLGLLGNYLFSGRPHLPGLSELQLAEAIVREPVLPVQPSALSSEQRALLTRIVERACRKEPRLRYSTLSEMQAEVALLTASFEENEVGVHHVIVGREAERKRLEEQLSRLRRGEGAFLLLLGEPGQGKSFLWESVISSQRRDEEAWCFYKSPQTGGYPYAAVVSLFRQLLKVTSPAERARVIGALSDGLQRALLTIAPGIDLGFPEGFSASASRGFDALLTEETELELARLLISFSESFSITVLALDDLQWTDRQSLGVITKLHELAPPRLGIVLIGRPEGASRLPARMRRRRLLLKGLADSEGEELLRVLLPKRTFRDDVTDLYDNLNRYAQGNPLAIVQFSRSVGARGINDSSVRELLRELGSPGTLVGALGRSRLQELSEEGRRFLRFLSLLAPPVPFGLLRMIPGEDGATVEKLLQECESSLLIVVDSVAEEVWFSHDFIESSARDEAMREPDLISRAARLLLWASNEGNGSALFALSRLIVSLSHGDRESPSKRVRVAPPALSPGEKVELLSRAARRSLGTMAAREALTFSEAALSMLSEANREEWELDLRMVAHEAAYRVDDAGAMSRHFARIYAFRDRVRVNEARQLWISRAYSSSTFSGAIRIGWRVLEALDSLPPWERREEVYTKAEQFVGDLRLKKVEEELLSRPLTTDPLSRLRIRTASRLLLPMLTVAHEHLTLLVYVIIRESLEKGRTGYTGIAFVAWALLSAIEGGTGSHLAALSRAASRLAEKGGDPLARHSTDTYARVFTLVWVDPYEKGMKELLTLHAEGNRLGNYQFASHCKHLYTQALLYHGAPLSEVYAALGEARAEMVQYNHHRTAQALAKYQQGVESLLGRTADPLLLSGSVIEERSYYRKIEGREDHLSISGFHILKGFLAMYEERPDLALESYRKLRPHLATIASLHDNAPGFFLWGLAAFRQGAREEAEAALQKLRRWARGVPENHEHRLFALLAEKELAKGHRRRGYRLYERARLRALENRYPHEAALVAEQQANHLGRRNEHSLRRRELLLFSYGLYSEWGALHAADRVRRKLGWAVPEKRQSPVVLEKSFVRGLIEAENVAEMVRLSMRELVRFSGAERAILRLHRSGREEIYTLGRGERGSGEVAEVRVQELTPALRALLEELRDGGEPVQRTLELEGDRLWLMGIKQTLSGELTLSALLLTAPGGAEFSPLIRARVSTAVTVLGLLLQLQATLLKSREQAEDLQSARREVAREKDYSRTLFGSLSEGLLLLNERNRILSYNPASTPYLRFGRVETAALAPEIIEGIRSLLRNEESVDPGEVEVSMGDRELRVSVTRSTMPEGAEKRLFAVAIRDITEQKKQEAALRRREQQLIVADRMSSLGMLSSTIAHEVSNPNHILQLNAHSLIMLLGQLRGVGENDGDALREAESVAEQILEGTQRIEAVVNRVKEYGRGGREEDWEVVPVEEICDRAYRFSRIMASQYTSHLKYEPGIAVPPIRVLRGLLEQAVINLIKNGCEALLDGTGRVRLATSYDASAEEVVISVADDGAGLDPRMGTNPGEPFRTGKAGMGGTGLGLSIVRTILERHGGRLGYREDEDYTTVAEIRMPPATER